MSAFLGWLTWKGSVQVLYVLSFDNQLIQLSIYLLLLFFPWYNVYVCALNKNGVLWENDAIGNLWWGISARFYRFRRRWSICIPTRQIIGNCASTVLPSYLCVALCIISLFINMRSWLGNINIGIDYYSVCNIMHKDYISLPKVLLSCWQKLFEMQ
jgi:hypothetical protein